ncbi:bile acid-transporting ATPase YBT1 KNAG_0E01120 [Huiozyma naganishii CBS 8797]|uniref:ATP-dependent bile acid permease n=1 Tax=Huiozyma naganishii (strain ATCC MYA-139 / BCRC 22969 / CBS 8797 / KCTC 17520 / NBRC 10181 / NCYC 3082 / Yp74L-3) TaxID=1071383 RepID=J7S6G9_HUIN7|nr:hypothetical protein KNAG_0E01120 [Kazachstania naganishii CBS 8797]CCK70379.1 hypothetical protein KNAG_0E01120 [Kazachstania naganishii CBS 8797]
MALSEKTQKQKKKERKFYIKKPIVNLGTKVNFLIVEVDQTTQSMTRNIPVHIGNGTRPVSCPFWDFDDVSPCGREKYINTGFPIFLSALAILFVSYKTFCHYYYFNKLGHHKEDIVENVLTLHVGDQGEHALENQPLLGSTTSNGYSAVNNASDKDGNATLNDRHFSIENIDLTKLDGTPHGKPQVIKREFIEKSRVIVEAILVLSQLFIHICLLVRTPVYRDFSKMANIAQLLLWVVITTIVTLRLVNVNQQYEWITKYPGNLWLLSFTLYVMLFLSSILPFRSILIGHIKSGLLKKYYSSQFWINLSLFMLLFLSPIKNTNVVLYQTDDGAIASPEPLTSVACFVCWGWFDRFVWTTNRRVIENKDVWGLIMEDYSIFVVKKYKKFTSHMSSQRGLAYKLLKYFFNYLILQAFWACLGGFFSFVPTILLKRILEYVEDQSSAPANLAWFYVISMFACKIIVALADGQALFFGRRVCIRIKSIIISEIYSKALKKRVSMAPSKNSADSPNAENEFEDPQERNEEESINADEESGSNAKLGTIINLMAIDAYKISEICAYLHFFAEAIVMTVIALVLLYRLIGNAAILGTVIILVLLPVNFKLATLLGDYQKLTLGETDKRIHKLNEALQSIRIIKFFSWENNFERDIMEIRERELQMLIKRTLAWVMGGFVWFVTPSIVTTASFAWYIYVQGEVLTTPVAFTALSLFTLLRDPLDRVSDMLSFAIQSKVSLERVGAFLSEAETEKYEQLTVDNEGKKLAFDNSTTSWDTNGSGFKLRNLNIDFKVGKLNVVIGATGSGKTSLLMALLGEMHICQGRIIVPSLEPRSSLTANSDGFTNSIAYCSQAAWLLNDTVRNNILFNSSFDENRYHKVVEACGLKRDFDILKAGDLTEIGEKGITLSGGQKQRISLARALYSDSKHLLLDDCLSAVDSHTASWIYDNCITGPLMVGRTCILVSHNIALTLRNAELVVILEDGRVKDQGDPLNLFDKGLLGEDELVKSSILSRNASMATIGNAKNATNGKSASNGPNKKTEREERSDADRTEEGKLIDEEKKAGGVVSPEVYKWYIRIFGGLKVITFMASLFVLAQIADIAQSYWVRGWVANNTVREMYTYLKDLFPIRSSVNTHVTKFLPLSSVDATISSKFLSNSRTSSEHSTKYYLIMYFMIGLTGATVGSLKTFLTYIFGINASRKIFAMLLNKVIHSKLRFFDTTPIGRIMNRFSKDIESVDQELTPYLTGAFYSFVECFSTIILISWITPQFFVVAILISIMYYLVGYFYMAGSRELKRLDSITKSPIYQHFSETLVGVTTIRAFGDEMRFLKENLFKIDENNKPFFYLWVANRWLSFRIDMIGSFVVFGAGVFILADIKNIDSGMAGISLTYAISFTEGALWLVRFYSEVEMNMNSVERIKEYMSVEQEPYDIKDEIVRTPPTVWPDEGKIEVNDLSLRYAANLPRVIKNVSFTVEPNSKVGVVGRTGAGKSTIITALFRFLDPESGYIKIDNMDITTIPLTRLRRAITIIPQDPTLFAGTLKFNLDPYDEYNDKDIFAALTRVNLVSGEELNGETTAVSDQGSMHSNNENRFLDLSNEITEGGGNLSQGQRQLICLARSLLRNPKILLLDEATASIDYESDARLQATIRGEFGNSTILTIAHRLRSVIDYDKILVMDAGEVIEYDHPYSLLLNRNSEFYKMCESSGELDTLTEMAKEAFVKKLNAK